MINVNDLLQSKYMTPRNLLILGVLLLILFCLTLLSAIWQWTADWQLTHAQMIAQAVVKTNNSAELIKAIPKEHLFGQSLSGEVPISSLQLRVTGIVKFAGSQDNSKAYISISGQPGKIYQQGDRLPYGVKIYSIASDAVILENDGHLEKLPLARPPLQFKPRISV